MPITEYEQEVLL